MNILRVNQIHFQSFLFSTKVVEVCLPESEAKIEKKVRVAGWGATGSSKNAKTVKKLQYVDLDTYGRSICQQSYNRYASTVFMEISLNV